GVDEEARMEEEEEVLLLNLLLELRLT
ncbi:hypothetical protein Pcinc_028869, partial [Petrolisthes cinctipes]